MEELFELRLCLEEQRYEDALQLLGEMEEMSKEDKIHKIRSYVTILLIHLIKRQFEQRTTRSWEFSIRYSIREIRYVNKRRKAGGFYLTVEELNQVLVEAYPTALEKAALEIFGGQYSDLQVGQQVNPERLLQEAAELIWQASCE